MAKQLQILLFFCLLLPGLSRAQILLYDDHSFEVDKPVTSMYISPDNRFLACGDENGTIVVWDLNANRTLHKLVHGSGNKINTVLIDSENKYVISGTENKQVFIWDLYSGEKLLIIKEYKGKVYHLALSQDEKILCIAGSKKEPYLFHFPGGKLIGLLRNGHEKEVMFCSFNRNGDQLISIGEDNQMIFWNVGNKISIRKSDINPHTIDKSGITVQSASVTADKSKIIIGYEEARLAKGGSRMIFKYNVAVYDWVTGILENIVEGNVKNINTLSVTPDNKYYITDNSTLSIGKINFWSVEGGNVVKNQRFDGDISSFTISAQGNWLAVADRQEKGLNKSKVQLFKVSGIQPSSNISGYQASGARQEITKAQSNLTSANVPTKFNPVDIPGDENINSPGKYYALIIGINNYEDQMINDLDAPLEDAQKIYEILTRSYTFDARDVIFLKNPTRTKIIDALDNLEKTVTPNDNLLIFYAGHGHWDENSHKGYWLPSDAQHNSSANWLRNSSLSGYIESIPSKHTLLIADACFSGSIFKTRSAFAKPSRAIQRLHDLPSRKAMTSGTLKEVPDQSVFLKYLMKRLNENQETYLPSEQLFFSLKPAVLNNSSNIPQFGEVKNTGDEGGEFIFILR